MDKVQLRVMRLAQVIGYLTGFLLLFCVNPTSAQSITYFVDEINTEDGLPYNWITDVLQDQLGFIWLGANNGLIRYDGYEFETFTSNPSDPSALQGRFVRKLFVDTKGDLWISTKSGGLHRFDRQTEHFSLFVSDSTTGFIYDFAFDEKGAIWLATQKGLFRLEPDNRTIHRLSLPTLGGSQEEFSEISALLDDSNGGFYVGTLGNGLFRFDREAQSFEQINPDNFRIKMPDIISGIQEDSNGILWLSANNGLYKYEPISGMVTHVFDASYGSQQDGFINNLILDDGTIWFSTLNRFYRFDSRTSITNEVILSYQNRNSKYLRPYKSIYRDHAGIFWITCQQGIVKLDTRSPSFSNLQHHPGNSNSLPLGPAGPIQEDSLGGLWIGNFRYGLTRFDKNDRSYRHYTPIPDNPNSLRKRFVTAVHVGHSNDVWVGIYHPEGGLQKYERDTDTFSLFQHDPNDPNSLINNHVNAILEDSEKNLWVGTYENIGTLQGGLSRLDLKTGHFESFYHNPKDSTSLGSPHILTFI